VSVLDVASVHIGTNGAVIAQWQQQPIAKNRNSQPI
jgi:hypothetical protein